MSSGLNWLFFPLQTQNGKIGLSEKRFFSRKRISLNLGGRTMKFDKVNEPEQNDQSSAIPKAVTEAATMLMALVSTKGCKHRI